MNMDFTKLPDNLPYPTDDGSCDHLLGMSIPSTILSSTKGNSLDVCKIDTDFVILYLFPMIGIPGRNQPLEWDNIPGVRGCTPQNIAINEHMEDLLKYGAIPVGISTQPIDELSKISLIRNFLQIILSDSDLKLQQNLNVPTFQFENNTMYKRLTLILKKSKIIKVFYPIFPPDKHIFEILKWLENNSVK
jgi:peroxiredoxin